MDGTMPMARAGWAALERWSLVAGVIGLAALAFGGFASPDQFFRSYLIGFVYWLGIGSGSLALLMIYHLTGGAWGALIRRVLEAASRTLPLMAVLFVTLVFGLSHVYVWTDTARAMADPVLVKKVAYLNVPFFLARAVLYFAVWLALAYFLNRWSREQDRTADPAFEDHLRRLSGIGLPLWGLAVTFAAFDWIMSLDPYWFSTIFGALLMGGQGLSALAFAIGVVYLLSRGGVFGRPFSPAHLLDLGNLLLATVMLFAYFSYSQLVIIWAGNLPEEIRWYLARIEGGWKAVAVLLAVFHFAVPFVLLLSRVTKRRLATLAAVAAMVLGAQLVYVFFLIGPEFYRKGLTVGWMDLAAVVGIGGLWLGTFTRQLARWPLLPQHDPELEAALAGAHAE